MRSPSITDARLLTALESFFPSTCAIKQRTDVADAVGQPIPTWSTVVGLSAIACRVAPVTALGQSRREALPEMFKSTTANVVLLAGYYATITTAMRVVIGSVTYTILAVLPDSELLCTELVVEAVTT